MQYYNIRSVKNGVAYDPADNGKWAKRLDVEMALAGPPEVAPAVNVEELAHMAHEVNRAYCQALGDHSQPSWEDAPEWQRNSAIHGVEMHMQNPDAGPAQSHESWMEEKVAEGWVYGEVKDPEVKTHPCLVPFDELPVEQQAKDFIFRAIVHAGSKLNG